MYYMHDNILHDCQCIADMCWMVCLFFTFRKPTRRVEGKYCNRSTCWNLPKIGFYPFRVSSSKKEGFCSMSVLMCNSPILPNSLCVVVTTAFERHLRSTQKIFCDFNNGPKCSNQVQIWTILTQSFKLTSQTRFSFFLALSLKLLGTAFHNCVQSCIFIYVYV